MKEDLFKESRQKEGLWQQAHLFTINENNSGDSKFIEAVLQHRNYRRLTQFSSSLLNDKLFYTLK